MSWRLAGLIAAGFLIVPGAVDPSPAHAQASVHIPPVYSAAQAERGGASLAAIRSLHPVIVRTRPVDFAPFNRGGGGMPPMGGMDGGPSQMMPGGGLAGGPMGGLSPTSTIQLWLALPDRFAYGRPRVGPAESDRE
jgi:hypothetical protein